MDEGILEALDLIVAEPQKNFPRFLFESDVLATVELLNELVVLQPSTVAEKGGSGTGHSLAIQCLWCWQDLVESAYGLSPVVDELKQTECVEVAKVCLKLIVNLLHLAPSPVSRIKVRRELNELQVDELVPKIREKFDWDCELEKWIGEWMSVGSSASVPLDESSSAGGVANRTDADSGTFSGEEDNEQGLITIASSVMVNSSNSSSREQLSEVADSLENDVLSQLITSLRSTTCKSILEPLCQIFLDLLKQIDDQKLETQPPETILQHLRACLHSPSTNGKNKNSSNSEVPSVVARMPPPPPPSIKLITGSPRPPPPPINGLMNRERSKDLLKGFNNTAASKEEAAVHIPNALRLKTVPAEGKKMRHLQWTKIPLNAIISSNPVGTVAKDGQTQPNNNIWQRMSHVNVMALKEKLDFSELDQNFCNNPSASNQTGLSATATLNFSQLSNQNSQKPVIVSLISGKRNLSVNIFLKMYKDVDKLIENLNEGQSELVGLERLKMLLQLLPTDEEQNTLNHYTGDSSALGQAEKFLLQLIKIADFKLRIEAMTFIEEFDVLMTDIEPDLETLIQACEELKSSSCLQKVLFVLLHMGNYLNHGAVLGNAVGFKLNSLWKINDVRATKGNGRTLLHFVAQQVSNCSEEMGKELAHIQDAAKLSFETLQSDLNGLQQRIQHLEKSSSKNTAKDAFFQQFDSFTKSSKSRLSTATSRLKQIEEKRRELAIYFCENEKTFSMEECFKIFHAFINRFKVACHENSQRAESGARKNEEMKQQGSYTTEKSSDSMGEDSLSKLLLSSDPYIPISKRPRHSISIPQQSSLQQALVSPRRSVVVLEQDRDRQLGISSMARRRSAHSATRPTSAGLTSADNPPSLFKSSIKEEMESEKASQPNNHLESFMDKALESTQVTRFPVRQTEPITTSPYNHQTTCKIPARFEQLKAKESKEAAKLCKKTSILSIPISPEEPSKDHTSSARSSKEPVRTHPVLRKTPQPPSATPKVFGESVTRTGVTRKNSFLQGIRTANNSSGVVIGEKTSNTVVQLKPSQLKAAQKESPITATCPVAPTLWKSGAKINSPTSPLGTKGVVFPSTVRKSSSLSGSSKISSIESATETPNKSVKKVSGNMTPLLRVATRNSQIKSKQEQVESIQRIQQNKHATTRVSMNVPSNSLSPGGAKVVAQVRKSAPLTASEKRQAMMTPSSSVSTSSRPALIKTGSISDQNKPKRWM